jgi:hypothetical protein
MAIKGEAGEAGGVCGREFAPQHAGAGPIH